MSKNPCVKDCPNRSATCHAECEKYAAFAKDREAELRELNHKRNVESRLDGQIIDKAVKARKRRDS